MKFCNAVGVYLIAVITFKICAQIPVIFIHYGNQDYLHCALRQAKKYNEWVILLSDVPQTYTDISWYNINDYRYSANIFRGLYQHLAFEPYNYHLMCFERWFILKDFLRAKAIDRCFYCESDVMLYCDVTRKIDDYKKCDFALLDAKENGLSSPQGHLYFGSIAYFPQKILDCFCSYMIDYYEKKFFILQKIYDARLVKGHGICDMTLTTFFVEDFRERYFFDMLSRIINNEQFDPNINCDQNETYEMCTMGGSVIKKIQWINGRPYCFNKQINKLICFCGLHFQGGAKKFMKSFSSAVTK